MRLAVGARFVLFTGGLVETKRRSLDEGVGRLLEAVDASQALPTEIAAESFAQHVISGDDDVAVITLDLSMRRGPRTHG